MHKVLSLTIIFLSLSVGVFTQGKEDARCPSISIEGPLGLTRPDTPITFEAKIGDDAKKYSPTYRWSTSTGKIVEGQGTLSIKVVQSKEEARSITVSLEVYGLPPDCPNLASESGVSDGPPPSKMLADFSSLEKELGSEEIDRIASEMKNAPNSQLFILQTFVNGTSQTKIRDTADRLLDLLTGTQQIARDRITILTGFSPEDRVTIYLVPPGADNPSCEKCEEFKDVVSPSCPSITITSPLGIIDWGEIATFKADVSPDVPPNVAYSWTISKGEIVSGQNTLALQIRIPKTYDMRITVTLEVRGLPARCPNSASEIYEYAIDPGPILIDEYGSVSLRREYARFRAAAVQLKKNPNSMLFLIQYPTKSDSAIRKKNKLITDYLTNVLHIQGLFRLVTGPNTRTEDTKIFIVPPGASNPQP